MSIIEIEGIELVLWGKYSKEFSVRNTTYSLFCNYSPSQGGVGRECCQSCRTHACGVLKPLRFAFL